jgi:hypothetical protein
MNVQQLKALCRTFACAAETLFDAPYNFLVYSVGGRKFAYFKTSQPERSDGASARELRPIGSS